MKKCLFLEDYATMKSANYTNLLEINVDNFRHNIREIKKLVAENVELMPVIKANAYGTYLNTQIDILNEFNIVAVANTLEGVFLRNLGYQKEIFVLNQPSVYDIDNIIENDLIIGVSALSFVDQIKSRKEFVKIHIEIGTGMGRTGINPNRSEEFVKYILKIPNIIIDGVYTHLSVADSDFEYTKKQLDNFDYAVNIIKKYVPKIRYIHSLASNGILNFSKYTTNYNLIRPGIIMYGYPSDIASTKKINLKPISTLKSKITFIKEVKKGTSIGYGRTFITNKDSIIATIPMGYADGIKRCLSNKWHVLINNTLAPIIGTICMDSFMVDVTNVPNVNINDDVYIWDNKIIKVEDIAKTCNTINYEILTSISERVPRIFK